MIRGGFRIAYDFAYYNLATNVQGSSPFTNLREPFASRVCRMSPLSTALISLPRFSRWRLREIPVFATELQFGPNFRNPYSQQWNLGIQRQIGGKMAAEVRYVGNHDLAQVPGSQREPRRSAADRKRVWQCHSRRSDAMHQSSAARWRLPRCGFAAGDGPVRKSCRIRELQFQQGIQYS